MSDVSLERGAVDKSESNFLAYHGVLSLRCAEYVCCCKGGSEVLSVSLISFESRCKFSSELNFETLTPFSGILLSDAVVTPLALMVMPLCVMIIGSRVSSSAEEYSRPPLASEPLK